VLFTPTITIGITTPQDTDPQDILRFLKNCDYPVFAYHCSCSLTNFDCKNPTCKFCTLVLTSYISWTPENTCQYHALPAPPEPVYLNQCVDHLDQLCDQCTQDCSVWESSTARYQIWEWNIRKQKFKDFYIDTYDPLKHGFFNRTKQEKEQLEKTRRTRQTRRNQTHPYGDPANRKARKDLAKDLAAELASLVVFCLKLL